MADKVRALCGKWVLPKKKALHERLCTKCAELSSPAENTAVGVPLQAVPMVEVPPEAIVEGGTESQQPGADAPQIDPPPSVDPAESDPPGDVDVVDRAAQKVVAMIAPSLNMTLQQVNTLIEQTKAAKPLTPEEQAALIDKAVERQITKMVEEQRATQAGGNGHAVAEPDAVMAAPANGGGDPIAGLLAIIQQAAPLFRHQAPPDNGLSALAKSIEGLTAIENAVAERRDGPVRQAKQDVLQMVAMLAKINKSDGLEDVVNVMAAMEGKEKPAKRASPEREPNE